ncbi:hypothetical protein [Streptomyces sp. CBMA152]|uniref:hypothetical protein n=1 Tax=Streptomyces sp. CBMA152 TaxID=1896312 RepID=UPI001CB758B2|nr:hypothetical protein [Streptomyces sp. CBMA152]
MTDLNVFRVAEGRATELRGQHVPVERELQSLIERNMEVMLGVRLLASEFSTGDRHGGRIDSFGLDESGSPVIVEYKRARDQNVMNQALFYLDWLLDHRGDFHLLVDDVLGTESAASIDWIVLGRSVSPATSRGTTPMRCGRWDPPWTWCATGCTATTCSPWNS